MSVLSENRRHIIQLMVNYPATTQQGIEAMIQAYQVTATELAELKMLGANQEEFKDDLELLQQLFEVVMPHIEMEGYVRYVQIYQPGSFGIPGNDTLH